MKRNFWRMMREGAMFWYPDNRNAGTYANHGNPCSCWMCGNPRRKMQEPTMQERRTMEQWIETGTVPQEYLDWALGDQSHTVRVGHNAF